MSLIQSRQKWKLREVESVAQGYTAGLQHTQPDSHFLSLWVKSPSLPCTHKAQLTCPIPSPPSPSLAHSAPAHGPPGCSFNIPSTILPQGLCTCYSLCLGLFPPDTIGVHFSTPVSLCSDATSSLQPFPIPSHCLKCSPLPPP